MLKDKKANDELNRFVKVVELDKRQRAAQLWFWLIGFLKLGPSAFHIFKHYQETDQDGFQINLGDEAIKECVSAITHVRNLFVENQTSKIWDFDY